MYRRITKKITTLVPQNLDLANLDNDSSRVARRYRKNVKTIIALAKKNSIAVVLIKQPTILDLLQYKEFLSFALSLLFVVVFVLFQRSIPAQLALLLLLPSLRSQRLACSLC